MTWNRMSSLPKKILVLLYFLLFWDYRVAKIIMLIVIKQNHSRALSYPDKTGDTLKWE